MIFTSILTVLIKHHVFEKTPSKTQVISVVFPYAQYTYFIAAGWFIAVWPRILVTAYDLANAYAEINQMQGSMAVFSSLRLRYPEMMLPILMFELPYR